MRIRFDLESKDSRQLRKIGIALKEFGITESDSSHAAAKFMIESILKGAKTHWGDFCAARTHVMMRRSSDKDKIRRDLANTLRRDWNIRVKEDTLSAVEEGAVKHK